MNYSKIMLTGGENPDVGDIVFVRSQVSVRGKNGEREPRCTIRAPFWLNFCKERSEEHPEKALGCSPVVRKFCQNKRVLEPRHKSSSQRVLCLPATSLLFVCLRVSDLRLGAARGKPHPTCKKEPEAAGG